MCDCPDSPDHSYTPPEPVRQPPKWRYSKADVATIMDVMFNGLRQLREAGQKEYAHEDDRPFRNFEVLAEELGTSREQVLWTFFRKHIDGILAWIRGHRSQREDVRGRINDAMVYLCLLRAMVDEEDQVWIPNLTYDPAAWKGLQLAAVKQMDDGMAVLSVYNPRTNEISDIHMPMFYVSRQ